MHGPAVDPKGQPLIVIKHRASEEKVELVLKILSCFESNIVHLSAEEHDRITADTQAVTHAAFLSMGSAWRENSQFPVSSKMILKGSVSDILSSGLYLTLLEA